MSNAYRFMTVLVLFATFPNFSMWLTDKLFGNAVSILLFFGLCNDQDCPVVVWTCFLPCGF
jgi:hypothetical protein